MEAGATVEAGAAVVEGTAVVGGGLLESGSPLVVVAGADVDVVVSGVDPVSVPRQPVAASIPNRSTTLWQVGFIAGTLDRSGILFPRS